MFRPDESVPPTGPPDLFAKNGTTRSIQSVIDRVKTVRPSVAESPSTLVGKKHDRAVIQTKRGRGFVAPCRDRLSATGGQNFRLWQAPGAPARKIFQPGTLFVIQYTVLARFP